MSDLAKFIDHTLLKPEATRAQIETLCAEAAEHQPRCVSVACQTWPMPPSPKSEVTS